MDEKDNKTIPWFSHEAEVARLERVIHRLLAFSIIIFISFVLSNIIWVQYEMQFEDVVRTEIEATQDGVGVNIVGGGDVDYGTESKDNHNENTP